MDQCPDTLLLEHNEHLTCNRPPPHYGHHAWLADNEEVEWYRPVGHRIHLVYTRSFQVEEPVPISQGNGYGYDQG